MKRILIAFFALAFFCNASFAEDAGKRNSLLQKEYDVKVVVIDPGHGGNDAGAVSKSGLYEKDITLKVAERLRSLIEDKLKLKVYLTRNGDKYVSLRKRTGFANEMKASLFISIHANSSSYLSISGCETYFFDKSASDEHARLMAEVENKGEILEGDESANDLEFILMDMAKNEFIELSFKFAEILQGNYSSDVKSRDRGVKQAPLMVLKGVEMPAVLTEIGFLSSRRDESRLQSGRYLENIAQAICGGIIKYKKIIDIKNGNITGSSEMID